MAEDVQQDQPDKAGQKPAAGNDRASAAGLDPRILTIARAIGRLIAREHIAALSAANDNERREEK